MGDAKTVLTVGGGPAGLTAAIAAAEAGGRVVVLERMPRTGTKLLATGGGRCNLTNVLAAPEYLSRFGKTARFMRPATYAMDGSALRRFFDALGVRTHCPDGFHVFPVSDSAREVRDALLARCRALGVEIRTAVEARRLRISEGALRGVETSEGFVPGDCVILAAGGDAWPALGSDGSGWTLAREAGHSVVPPVPALVPLLTRETWPHACAGIVVKNVGIRFDRKGGTKGAVTGDLLFTHRGLSGPAALDFSREASRALADGDDAVGVVVHLTGETREETWRERVAAWARERPRRLVRNLAAEAVPGAVADAFCLAAGVPPETPAAHLTRDAARRLAAMLAGARLTVAGTEGREKAMVSSGGVALDEVEPATLRSRRIAGLSFAGEVLNVDGPCGGYNLQWAFSSGRLAGRRALDPPPSKTA